MRSRSSQHALPVGDVTYSSDDLTSTPVHLSLDRPDSLDVPSCDVIERSPRPSRRQLIRQTSINPHCSQDSLVGKVMQPNRHTFFVFTNIYVNVHMFICMILALP